MEVLHFMIPPRLYHQLIIKSLTYTIFSTKKKENFLHYVKITFDISSMLQNTRLFFQKQLRTLVSTPIA